MYTAMSASHNIDAVNVTAATYPNCSLVGCSLVDVAWRRRIRIRF